MPFQKKPFKYKLSDEEIDIRMRAVLNKEYMKFKGNNFGHTSNPRWEEPDIILRDTAIIRLLVKGYSIREVALDIADRWGVCYETARKYVKGARERLAKCADENIDTLREEAKERLQNVLLKSLENGDRKNALAAIDQLNKINGLYTDKKEVNITDLPTSFKFGE